MRSVPGREFKRGGAGSIFQVHQEKVWGWKTDFFNEPTSPSLPEKRVSRSKNCNKILDNNCFVRFVFSGHFEDAIERDIVSKNGEAITEKPRIKIPEKPYREIGNPDQIVVQ